MLGKCFCRSCNINRNPVIVSCSLILMQSIRCKLKVEGRAYCFWNLRQIKTQVQPTANKKTAFSPVLKPNSLKSKPLKLLMTLKLKLIRCLLGLIRLFKTIKNTTMKIYNAPSTKNEKISYST